MSTRIGRRRFLALAGGGVLSLLVYYLADSSIRPAGKVDLMRPPGAVEENAFEGVCIRCQRCIYVCPTKAIKSATTSDGLSKVFTPILDGECIYCWKCIQACPSGALRQINLADYKVGDATVKNELCIKCYICLANCPFDAITTVVTATGDKFPLVIAEKCTGCAKCWAVCPVRPIRAITVSSEGAKRIKVERLI